MIPSSSIWYDTRQKVRDERHRLWRDKAVMNGIQVIFLLILVGAMIITGFQTTI